VSARNTALREQASLLYAKHHDWLLQWLRSRLGCSHEAAGLAQDIFVPVLAAPDAGEQKPRGGRQAERNRSGDCSTRQGNATMTSFGLCRQRRGNGVACPGNRRAGEKCAGEAVAGENSGA